MLKDKEIKLGGVYAWDVVSCSTPRAGCNIFTILKIFKEDYKTICIVESIDGYRIDKVDSQCLIPEDRALKRLNLLRNINVDTLDNLQKSEYLKELEYLKMFERSLVENSIFTF